VGRKKRNFSRIGKKPEGEVNPWEHSERAKMRRRGLMMHLKCWGVVEGDWRLRGGETRESHAFAASSGSEFGSALLLLFMDLSECCDSVI
jgi:hypothetical protein